MKTIVVCVVLSWVRLHICLEETALGGFSSQVE
jgi:hypothetical protein